MNIQEQIDTYIASLPEAKRNDIQALHLRILQIAAKSKLWFLDGKNSEGKVIANPNIGYGYYTLHYSDGSSKPFYRVGLSANKTGISVYILGIKDHKYLAQTYGEKIGKAMITSYCIKFKALKHINIDILEAAIEYGLTLKDPEE